MSAEVTPAAAAGASGGVEYWGMGARGLMSEEADAPAARHGAIGGVPVKLTETVRVRAPLRALLSEACDWRTEPCAWELNTYGDMAAAAETWHD